MKSKKLLQTLFGMGLMLIFLVGCRASATPKPMLPPDGPWLDEVYGATSIDGLNFTEIPGPFFRQASVPDVVEITSRESQAAPRGMLLLYYVDFSNYQGPNQETLSMAASTDGRNWSVKRMVVLRGNKWPIAVDPSVVELPDGRLRLYYYGADFADPLQNQRDHEILSAVSADGINFEVEPGVRFQAPLITDPEVIKAGDEWLMFYWQRDMILLARSRDGLEFKADKRFKLMFGGIPGAVLLPDGKVRVFGLDRGIVSALYDVGASTPKVEREGGVRIPAGTTKILADPSCVRRLDGTYYMIFKKRP